MDLVTPALPPARAPRLTHSATANLQPPLGLGNLVPLGFGGSHPPGSGKSHTPGFWGNSSPWVLGSYPPGFWRISSPWVWGISSIWIWGLSSPWVLGVPSPSVLGERETCSNRAGLFPEKDLHPQTQSEQHLEGREQGLAERDGAVVVGH